MEKLWKERWNWGQWKDDVGVEEEEEGEGNSGGEDKPWREGGKGTSRGRIAGREKEGDEREDKGMKGR